MVIRKIEPEMIKFLDDRLKDNGLAALAVKTRDARLLMTEAVKVCVGIREKTGNNDGPMVELIQETIGSHSREAWCMALVQTMIAYAELKTGLISPIYASEHCMTTWRETPAYQRVKIMPLPGAIVIWKHGNTDNGHTGIVLGCDDKKFQAVEGNTTYGTNLKGEVIRDGGGVYYTVRSKGGNSDMRVVGFLKPF